MIAASLANMTVGGDGNNQYEKSNRLNLACFKSNEDAAKDLNVSLNTVKNAKEVKRDAPDLAEKVSRGGERGNQYQSINAVSTAMAPPQEDHTAPEEPCKSHWAYQPLSVILEVAQRG